MKRTLLTAAAAALLLAGSNAYAQQQDFSKVEVKTTDLGHNTYMLEGAGGNVTVAVGSDSVIIVDAQFAPMHDKLKAAIAKITNLPVKYLINTHYHGDHTGGNEAFGKEGVTIFAHQNLKDRLANPPPGNNGQRPPASPADALPKQIYTDKTAFNAGGRTAELFHMEGHTDTDTFVYFPDANVLAIGDTGGPAPRLPNIALGATIDGEIAGVRAYVNLANAQTKIVPGHARVSTKADLQAYLNSLVTMRDRIAKLKAEGKTEDQAVAAKPLADIQAKAKASDMQADAAVRRIYQTLKS